MGNGGGPEIGVRELVHWAGLTFNIETLYMTWVTMALVIFVAILATRRLSIIPSGWQNLLEVAVVALLNQIESTMGPKGRKLAPIIITLFLFLLLGNWLGLVPGFSSPTSDLNTTLGLALMVLALVHIMGAWNHGLFKHLKHFIQPTFLFLPINIIEEISKPITLSFRLFGNILAGEILIIILSKLVPYIIPTAWLAFSVFVGLVQAAIFTILSMSYLSNSLKDEA